MMLQREEKKRKFQTEMLEEDVSDTLKQGLCRKLDI
jgi:hypothetical protein